MLATVARSGRNPTGAGFRTLARKANQELFKRISPEDVAWASEWLGKLSDQQWSDAFRAGGFEPQVADRFIGRLHQKVAEGRELGEHSWLRRARLPLPTPTAGKRR